MPIGQQKSKNPEINSQAREKKRGRPPGRKNASVRADRAEACRAVAAVLIDYPTASITYIAGKAFQNTNWCDKKEEKKAHERARQALKTLAELDDARLAQVMEDTEMAAKVREALRVRREEEERKQWERLIRQEIKKKEREEEEKNLHLIPARVFLLRLLSLAEVREEFAVVIRERRRQIENELSELAAAREAGVMPETEYMRRKEGLTAREEMVWALALAPDQMVDPTGVMHFRVGYAGSVLTAAETARRARTEIMIQRRAANMVTIPFGVAKNILETVRIMRRARRKKDRVTELTAKEKLRWFVGQAIDQMGWADPELSASQLLETAEARNAREEAILREIIKFYPKLPAILTRDDTEDWPDPYRGRPLEGNEDDDDMDEAAAVAREAAGQTWADAAGGRRRGRGGAGLTDQERAAVAEGLHLTH